MHDDHSGTDAWEVGTGASSKDLTVPEAGDVMEMISAFGAFRNVVWTDPEKKSMEAT
jgi:hypothetical protein